MVQRVHVSTLIAVRLVVSTLLLGSAILLQLREPGVFPVEPLFLLIGATYALSAVYVGTLRFVERWPWLVDAQLSLDAVLVSAFIHATGGITSYFSSLYLMPIITASIFRWRPGGLRVAALSATLYLGLVVAQYGGVSVGAAWQPARVDLPNEQMAQYTMAINLSGFFLVAWLSGSLAEKVRTAGARLEDASLTMRDLRAFNQLVIDSLQSGLITTDIECRIITVNRAAVAITGRAGRDAVGRDACDVLQAPAEFRAGLSRLQPHGSARLDLAHRTMDGRVIDLGIAASMLALPGGRTGYLFTFQDVTVAKRQERDARRQQRLAAVGQMAAGIAHEIRNPLASMSGSMQVLRGELPLNEEQGQLMDIVLKESDRLNATIREFLDYARPRRPSVARVDLGRLLREAALLLRNSPEVRESHRIEAGVPPDAVWCDVDEHHLRQVVWNLATNGLRAMPDGGRLALSVAEQETPDAGREIVLEVSDEGCGIPPEELDRVFEPFHSTFASGSGLGMAIVHRLVTDSGGTIEMTSTVGRGTDVRVHLPLAPAGVPEQAMPGSEAAALVRVSV